MAALSVAETAKRWRISERSVRNYCALGRVAGAVLTGKTWSIPEDAAKPERLGRRHTLPESLPDRLKAEKSSGIRGGIYHRIQIDLTYNSNHMEGSQLSHDQTRLIFETNTIGLSKDQHINVDDIIEAANHFRCIDRVIDTASHTLSESFIKQLHAILKNGTTDSRLCWFATGDYKRFPNDVGGRPTSAPEEVRAEMRRLLSDYNADRKKSFDDLLEFHWQFERIHPFQDGNGRIGRLILFKECLRNGIVPFIIYDDMKLFYYRGLKEWPHERGYLRDTCLAAQDRFREVLDYFRIPCNKR